MDEFIRSIEGQELAALCIDLGYKLAIRAGDLTRDQINFLLMALRMRTQTAEAAQQFEDRMAVLRQIRGQG